MDAAADEEVPTMEAATAAILSSGLFFSPACAATATEHLFPMSTAAAMVMTAAAAADAVTTVVYG